MLTLGTELGTATTSRRLPQGLSDGLTARLGDRFTLNKAICLQHGTDESHYNPMAPDAVAYPLTTEEVSSIVRLCGEYAVPVIAFGIGSSVEGHLIAVQGGVSIDLTRMNAIVAIRPEDLTATVQAGVTREDLNAALTHTGFFFSVDPGANATIGGMVATAASGTNTVRYGTMRDNIVSLTVVTADGNIIRTASRAKKTSAGYCLTQLFAGSEGTLGVITEVTVKLHPHPESIAAAVVNFPDVRCAVQAVIGSIQAGIPLARAELLDALAIKAINAHDNTELKVLPTIFFEFAGSAGQIREQAEFVESFVAEYGGGDFNWATRPEERSRLWKPRHHAYFACLQLKPGSRSFTTDACVPLSSLAECVSETVADIEATGMLAPVLGHVGDGHFHCLILADPSNSREMAIA
jgi:D-lactate dehydrogenase (cytochrome)